LDISTLEDRTATLSRNIKNKLPSDAVSYPRGTDTSFALLRRQARAFSVLFWPMPSYFCLVCHCHSLRKGSFSISFMYLCTVCCICMTSFCAWQHVETGTCCPLLLTQGLLWDLRLLW